MSGLSYKMDIKGLDKLTAALIKRAKMDVVKQIIKQNTAELQSRAQAMTSTVYAHPTGATKRGIRLAIQDNGLSGIVGMTMEYNPYLENGTRFMRAKPVLKPSFLYQKVRFAEQLKKAAK